MSKVLNVGNVVDLLYERGYTKKEAKEFIDIFLDVISGELINGNDIKLFGFGNFKCAEVAARSGRNPKTGESVDIPKRRTVRFKLSKNLKESVNKKYEN